MELCLHECFCSPIAHGPGSLAASTSGATWQQGFFIFYIWTEKAGEEEKGGCFVSCLWMRLLYSFVAVAARIQACVQTYVRTCFTGIRMYERAYIHSQRPRVTQIWFLGIKKNICWRLTACLSTTAKIPR